MQTVYIHSIILRAAGCANFLLHPMSAIMMYPHLAFLTPHQNIHKYTTGIADAPWGPDVLVNLVCWHIVNFAFGPPQASLAWILYFLSPQDIISELPIYSRRSAPWKCQHMQTLRLVTRAQITCNLCLEGHYVDNLTNDRVFQSNRWLNCCEITPLCSVNLFNLWNKKYIFNVQIYSLEG